MVCGRGNNVDNAILDQLRQIAARLDVVEIAQRRGAHIDDVSDDEVVAPTPNLELEEDQDEERSLRVLSRAHPKLVIEVFPYNEKLDTNFVLDWIHDMEKFYKFEKILDNRKVKIVVTVLKGHSLLWWEHLKTNRKRR